MRKRIKQAACPSVSHHFDSFDAMIEQAVNGKICRTRNLWAKTDGRFSHHGTETFQDAVDLARNGWPEGRAQMVEGMESAATLTRQASVPCLGYDVAGMFPDVPRFIAGDPCNMVNVGWEQSKAKPVVSALINIAVPVNVSRQEIVNRGVAILSMVDRAESDGMSVEINLVYSCRASKHANVRFTATTTAKRAGEPLEIDRLAFMLAHPSMCRRFCHALNEQVDSELFHSDAYFYLHGIPTSATEPGQICFPVLLHGECLTLADAVERVNKIWNDATVIA